VAPVVESTPALIQTDLRADHGTIDDRWAAISQTEVPGFAGLWYDEGTGAIVVAATELESESAARDWVARTSASDDFRGAPVRFQLASYDFMQLRTWKAAARELLRRSDVVYIDADEVRNRLVLGVTLGAMTSEVRARARELEIPDAGLELITTTPLDFSRGTAGGGEATAEAGSSTLEDEVRPTMAGLEIEAQDVGDDCTLGFNATLAGESGVYFGTASHCSTDRFDDPDNGYWLQDANGHRVGRESYDIEPFTGSASFGGQSYSCFLSECRFSDASLIAYDDSIDAGDVDLGRVAETTGEESNTIDGRRDVTKKRYHYTLKTGQTVQMMGNETGQSTGQITHTCMDTDLNGNSPVLFLCQFGGDYEGVGGDSGAPVYSLRPDGTAALVGIHFAQTTDFGPAVSAFSSMDGIEADLNVTLDVCIPTGCYALPPVDVEIDGPTEVLEWSQCVYTANATDGFPPYGYRWFIDGDSVTVGGAGDELEIEDVGEDDLLLEVRVTDDVNHVEWDDLLVDVSSSHASCGLSP